MSKKTTKKRTKKAGPRRHTAEYWIKHPTKVSQRKAELEAMSGPVRRIIEKQEHDAEKSRHDDRSIAAAKRLKKTQARIAEEIKAGTYVPKPKKVKAPAPQQVQIKREANERARLEEKKKRSGRYFEQRIKILEDKSKPFSVRLNALEAISSIWKTPFTKGVFQSDSQQKIEMIVDDFKKFKYTEKAKEERLKVAIDTLHSERAKYEVQELKKSGKYGEAVKGMFSAVKQMLIDYYGYSPSEAYAATMEYREKGEEWKDFGTEEEAQRITEYVDYYWRTGTELIGDGDLHLASETPDEKWANSGENWFGSNRYGY